MATYDQSCNNLAFPDDCPFGSVHNIHKQQIGPRVAAQLHRLMHAAHLVTEGPRAIGATEQTHQPAREVVERASRCRRRRWREQTVTGRRV